MKSENELLTEAILFANKQATLVPSGLRQPLLTGVTTVKVDPHMAQEYLDTMDIIITNLSKYLNDISAEGGYDNTEDSAMRLFQYIFDRTVESFYLELTGQGADSVNFELLEVGGYYELNLPDGIQLGIKKIVGNVVDLSKEVYRLMQGEDYQSLSFTHWIRVYMFTAFSVAMHYVQEIDFEG